MVDTNARIKELEESIELYEAMKEGVGVRISDLETKISQLQKTLRSYEDQLIWLASWCKKELGVDVNSTIGDKSGKYTLVEVVAEAVESKIERLDRI